MKKVMITVGAAIVASAINAASFQWSSTGTVYDPAGTSMASTGFTAYLFDSSAVSQSALVAALRAGGSIADYTALDTFTTSNAAKISKQTAFETTTAAGDDLSSYFAIITTSGGTDYVYISNEKTVAAQETATVGIAFASQSTSSASVNPFETAYSSAGWYATSSVPEPTSGLLMLLGMAGLALRRRRA